jgi:hypothetical protein
MRGLFFVERTPSLPRRDSSRRSHADRVNLAPWSASSTERLPGNTLANLGSRKLSHAFATNRSAQELMQ